MTNECTHDHDGCATEHVDGTRRGLLQGSALATAALITGPAWLPRMSFARSSSSSGAARDVLVHVYLRGGADGLTIVPPYGDPQYYLRRPTLSIPQPGQLNGAVPLPGNSLFGLAP